jgi:hypothetical protein
MTTETKDTMKLDTELHLLECGLQRAIGLRLWREAEKFKQRIAQIRRELGEGRAA